MSYTHVYYAKYSISLTQSDNNADSVMILMEKTPTTFYLLCFQMNRKKEREHTKKKKKKNETDDSYHRTMAGNQKET